MIQYSLHIYYHTKGLLFLTNVLSLWTAEMKHFGESAAVPQNM